MSKRRVIDDSPYIHFVTFGVDKRRQLLDMDVPREIFLDVLSHQLASFSAKCIGFVVMPEHVHLLIWFPGEGQLSKFMHGLKRMSSFRIRKWLSEQELNYFDGVESNTRFWTPKYYSFEIENARKLEEKLEYIHLNPVRRGLVDQAVKWNWSSAKWYFLHEEAGVPIDWIDC